MGRQLVPLAIVLAIGFWIGQRLTSAKKVVEEKTLTVHELDDETKNKLQALTENEIADYYRLKTLEEKYKKADEILGRIMQIFLADLGLKISQQTQNLAKHPVEPANTPEPPPKPEPKPTPVPPPAAPDPRREHYYSLASVKSLKDIDEFLALAKIEGEPRYNRLNLPFSNRDEILSKLKGIFAGRAQILEPNRPAKTLDIVFQLDGTYEGRRFRGMFYSKIAEEGRNLGQVSNIGQLREYSSDPFGMLINFLSSNTVLQLYYFPNLDVIGGHVYRMKLGGMLPVGSFQLKRPDDPNKPF